MRRVSIPLNARPYEALIEPGLLRASGAQMVQAFSGRRLFVVTVPPVRKHWGTALAESLAAADLSHEFLEIADGERAKTFANAEHLATRMLRGGADRSSVVVAFGGGVVGDLAAFVASIYMRGVDCVQVPTTFLAQVDASIGGKTGVNLKEGKNLLGTFHHPHSVLIDPAVLSTLPEREYRSGLYEALKCGVIRNPEVFEFMDRERERVLRRDPEALEWLIAECVKVKASVVAEDEREADVRRILNFGHTIGHALEAETRYKHFLHGEAVAWGMVAAAMIAAAMQKTESETARRIISLILAYAPLPPVEARGRSIARRLIADKKTRNGITHFILPLEVGRVEIVPDIPERAVVQAVEELRYLSQS